MTIDALKPQPDRLRKTLLDLLTVASPTGDTDAMAEFMRQRLAPFAVRVSTSTRGNVSAVLGDGEPTRALAAHMDTLGAMVQAIRPDGRLELTPLGTWSARFAEGARVTVKTGWSDIRGTVLPLLSSGHAYSNEVDTQPVSWSNVTLRLDIPTESAAETQAAGVQCGDIVTVDPQPEFLPNGYLVSRFLDNKAAIACCLEALALLKESARVPKIPVCFAFTNAEEIGYGAGTALPQTIRELISVDIAPVAPNQNSHEHCATLGFKDASGPHSRILLRRLEQLARRQNIPCVRDVFRHYHSDCSSTLAAGYDTRTALLGFGTDSTHGYERTHINSLLAVTELMVAWVLDDNTRALPRPSIDQTADSVQRIKSDASR